jgi:hypothetical protein
MISVREASDLERDLSFALGQSLFQIQSPDAVNSFGGEKMMEGSSIVGMIIYGIWIALVITLPILAAILVGRAIRRMDTPHQKEMRRLFERMVESLEEHNRLLNQQFTGQRPGENAVKNRPAGEVRTSF